jgi:Domain of unknown function (DUF4331)
LADHNDPNSVNSIFSDIDIDAADLYDLFGYPADDDINGEAVVIALTFAPVPDAGVLDSDLLYRIQIVPHPRVPHRTDWSLKAMLRYASAVGEKFFGNYRAADIRVAVNDQGMAHLAFSGFAGGTFSVDVETNHVHVLTGPNQEKIKVFIGGRDDAFFNDLPGFFRSINYAPQFYHIPQHRTDLRELPIPKTLIELEGNDLFNFDPAKPDHGRGMKLKLPDGPITWTGTRFKKDESGNFRFVYSGEDAQAGRNINAIVLEIPLTFITRTPQADRIVNIWGESWVLKASAKVASVPDTQFWREHLWAFIDNVHGDSLIERYKVVDTVGQPFADAALNEREDNRQLGANNHSLALHFVRRLGHLGWGFGPSISALGLQTSFDHDNAPVSVHRKYRSAVAAFPRTRQVIFQSLNMPDASWNKRGLDINLRRPYEIFIPNVCSVDMDTTGTWPFGRRPEDQVATRFLALFLDMNAKWQGKKYHLDLLADQSLWNAAPIVPKTPPNPLHNDKEFLMEFPYLAAPW